MVLALYVWREVGLIIQLKSGRTDLERTGHVSKIVPSCTSLNLCIFVGYEGHQTKYHQYNATLKLEHIFILYYRKIYSQTRNRDLNCMMTDDPSESSQKLPSTKRRIDNQVTQARFFLTNSTIEGEKERRNKIIHIQYQKLTIVQILFLIAKVNPFSNT